MSLLLHFLGVGASVGIFFRCDRVSVLGRFRLFPL